MTLRSEPASNGALVRLKIKADRRNLPARLELLRRMTAVVRTSSRVEQNIGEIANALGVREDICARVLQGLVREGTSVRRARQATAVPVRRSISDIAS